MTVNERKDAGFVAKVGADFTGVRFTHADVPLLDRVLMALRGSAEQTGFPVPDGYLKGGDGDRLRRRALWRFVQPPEEFLSALARLRRLTVICPGAEVRQHTEVPWQWTGLVPGVCDGDRPVLVVGSHLGELAAAMEAAIERRTSLRATLDGMRASWEDSYQVWYGDEQWWGLRQDGHGQPMRAPSPDALYKLLAEDSTFSPVRPR
jgi:hypothetical protein